MQIKSIVAAAAIALVTGVGSVSADELSVADTAGDTGAPFVLLDGIATEQMSVQELAATRGIGIEVGEIKFSIGTQDLAGPYTRRESGTIIMIMR